MEIKKLLTLGFAIALFSTSSSTAFAAGGGAVLSDPGAMEGKHFHPKGKLPSEFTIKLQNGLRKSLPFEDKRDFEEAKKGFMAAPDYKQIMASYEFLLTDKEHDSIHPSLQRQAVLNMAYGLYEVLPGKIYHVRGYDLANISFIEKQRGRVFILDRPNWQDEE